MITLVKVDQYFLVFDSVVFFFLVFLFVFLSFIACGTSLPKPPFYFSITTNIRVQ